MPVQLSMPVGNAAALLDGGFTHVEVWHSSDRGATWEALTSQTSGRASILSAPASTMFELAGTEVVIEVDGASYVVDFDPNARFWTPQQAVDRINQVVNCADVVGSQVRLRAPTAGRAHSVMVVSSDASSLAFTVGTRVYGTDVFIPLVRGVLGYDFFDPYGGVTRDLYKWRFSANGVAPISDFTTPVAGQPPSTLPISLGVARFIGIDGTPQPGSIIVAESGTPVVAGYFINGGTKIFSADSNGLVQVPLLRGARVRIAVEGTSLVRDLTVPDAASFDMLQALTDAADPFTIVSVDFDAPRRSLS